MKKLVTIALLCAMLLSCFAGCAMQKGEIYVAEEANVAEVGDETAAPGILKGLRDNVEKAKNNAFTADEVDVWVEGTALDDSWTSDNTIRTAAQFMDFQNKLSADYKVADITLAKNINLNGAKLEGKAKCIFKNFDGGNHVIYNFTLTLDATQNHGLLGNFSGAIFQNLALVDVKCNVINATGSKTSVGALFGYVNTESELKNLYSDAIFNFEDGKEIGRVGGLVGRVTQAKIRTFKNCEFAGSIKLDANDVVGEIFGFGGIVGYRNKKENLNFVNCLNSGTIGGADALRVGGFLGSQNSTGAVSFVNCINTGAITGKETVGSMVGEIEFCTDTSSGSVSVTGCKNTATIIGASDASSYVGKVTEGATSTIENCTNLVMAGYQVTAVGEDNKYDIRFVAAFDDDNAKAAGFVVSVYYKDANGKQVKFENKTVYASTVYTSVKGTDADGKELAYAAEAYGADYLYTLVLENIPADYTVDAGTLEIIVTPFITDANAENVINGLQVQRGEIVIEAPAE